MVLGDVVPAGDLRLPTGVTLPGELAKIYGPTGVGIDFRSATRSPNLPTMGPVTAAMVEQLDPKALGVDAVDGVIVVDPLTLKAVLELTGPVEVQGRQIDASNVLPAVLHDNYTQFDSPEDRPERRLVPRRHRQGGVRPRDRARRAGRRPGAGAARVEPRSAPDDLGRRCSARARVAQARRGRKPRTQRPDGVVPELRRQQARLVPPAHLIDGRARAPVGRLPSAADHGDGGASRVRAHRRVAVHHRPQPGQQGTSSRSTSRRTPTTSPPRIQRASRRRASMVRCRCGRSSSRCPAARPSNAASTSRCPARPRRSRSCLRHGCSRCRSSSTGSPP